MKTSLEFFDSGEGIVTLCGSTKFFEQYMEASRQLTFKGWMVLTCGSFGHSYHKNHPPLGHQLETVKELHFKKIYYSEAIVVVHDVVERYIGSSTRAEISYARSLDVAVFYFDGEKFTGTTEVPSNPHLLEPARESLNYWKESNSLGY